MLTIIIICHLHLLVLVQPSGARDQSCSLFNLNAPQIFKETHHIIPQIPFLEAKLCRLFSESSKFMVLKSADILISFI